MKEKSINLNGRLLSLKSPVVMGILNVTPDSFYAGSRQADEAAVAQRIETILAEGGAIVDIGGYSSRPDAAEVTEEEEWQRIKPALKRMQRDFPEVPVSVDTFRSAIARRAVEEYGTAMINDISGGMLDARMFETIALLQVPYILMHMRGTPQTMQQHTDYDDLMEDIMLYFAQKVRALRQLGVNDVILDPGFGFAKTLEQNYELMRSLSEFSIHFETPLLVGISRKSMIYKLLNATPEDSLNGTTVLNTYALLNGADILRVHDVKAATETIEIVKRLMQS
ncbi:dihydropteroate synthase [Tannerella forsythia]|uniref:dihydropteroate synthase n=1 Tax=Tannerella forsythia TaxID=28112 RepID=A0A2A6EB70_TANFO|nr:dihydropteroate synthase [Tannerella forsythia]KKY61633.1 dihydropteroate synthase [Tannerella forsythia]PDP44901.1 dihydropteroate synthase [Tannerella forsythia]PDP71823.1 dihydropteroate synthase [Tannerella forsythia]TPE15034.1 dihydropteroate synthase [Tannerella forsythia]